ncbi:uncharacterized protein LOC113864335 [Abrus precatorius]|uniref:Uncharacterized protein LOC113864335 n=1 Tax=Abrus precatorius TaxID=3816 RepID=A0A8B8LG29_ABRPR|nr:uncharacterized protein LOC113864335 [Abrus precatorius]
MFDIDDELTIESFRIPWLIWIQLWVLLLLLVLLFFLAIFPSDPNNRPATADIATDHRHVIADITALPSPSPSLDDIQQIQKSLANHGSTPAVVTHRQHRLLQGGQNLFTKGEITTAPSIRREEITEEEASSLDFHPCHYFQLATVAFLKCFGLDSTSDRPSTRKHRKRK